MVNGTLLKAKSCSQGVPQGAVCSPILFTLTYVAFYVFFLQRCEMSFYLYP